MIGYIYKITNLINNLSYIGQTNYDVKHRWQRHISDSFSNNDNKKYAIHRAINQYGISNFKFEILEECNQQKLNEKEQYWINFYDTYNNGYNLTKGGAGSLKIDYDLVISLYLTNKFSINQLAKKLSINRRSVSHILEANHIPHNENAIYDHKLLCQLAKKATAKQVSCINPKTNIIIKTFESQTDAARWLIEQGYSKAVNAKGSVASKISQVCNGKQKTAYGFKWSR